MTVALRFFVTGTDTDVGKTHVTAALARALRGAAGPEDPVTIVKAVQTGLEAGEEGDAALAARLGGAGIVARELYRFRKPADPHSAALAERRDSPRVAAIASELASIPGALVVEGAGGAAVPLNAQEPIAQIAREARLRTVVVVGVRLGCISHTLLTTAYLHGLGVPVWGAVLVDRWKTTTDDQREDVVRAIAPKLPILAHMGFDDDAEAAIAPVAATLLATLRSREG